MADNECIDSLHTVLLADNHLDEERPIQDGDTTNTGKMDTVARDEEYELQDSGDFTVTPYPLRTPTMGETSRIVSRHLVPHQSNHGGNKPSSKSLFGTTPI